jgi:hypothetical protein
MVSKQDIKDLDFDTIEEYYHYIYSSEVNGQRKQVMNLIQAMSRPQKKDALDYLEIMYECDDLRTVKQLIMEAL